MNLSANLISSPLVTGIIIAVVVVIVIAVIAWYISTRNNFVRLINNCEESLSGIDVYLKKRYDLIPNLVETVKGYTKHEGDTLERVISARNRAMSASGEGKVQAQFPTSSRFQGATKHSEKFKEKLFTRGILELKYAPFFILSGRRGRRPLRIASCPRARI